MIITTSQKASLAIKEETKELAKSLDLVYLNRQKRPISELLLEDTPIAVVSKNQLTILLTKNKSIDFIYLWLNCVFYAYNVEMMTIL